MEAMNKMPKEKLSRLIRWAAETDTGMQYMLVARLVPLSMDDTVVLLQEAAACFREGAELLSFEAQARLAFVTGALLEKAHANVRAGVLLGGACICFAVVRALEPMVALVASAGGDVALRRLVHHAFDVLREIIIDVGDKLEFSLIALMAQEQMNERGSGAGLVLGSGSVAGSVSVAALASGSDFVSGSLSGGRYFDEEWMDIVKGFKLSAQKAGKERQVAEEE